MKQELGILFFQGLHTEDRKGKHYEPLESYFCTLPWILKEAVATQIQQRLAFQKDSCLSLMPEFTRSKQNNHNMSFLAWRIFSRHSKLLNLRYVLCMIFRLF